MKTEEFFFSGVDGVQLPAVLWLPERPPVCLVQITHGMTEHMGCYEDLARKLTEQGIAVAGFDLRGHGRHPAEGNTAALGEGEWEATLRDMKDLSQLLRRRLPEIDQYLMGFSLGSFLVRDYLSRYSGDFDGAVIMGTGNQPGWLLGLMMMVVRGQVKKVGYRGTSSLIRKLSFEAYNGKFKPNRTDMDWLCGDEEQLDIYRRDPLCRREISAGLFYQMLEAMCRTCGPRGCENWPRAMPVLVLCGAQDPVGDMGKGALAFRKQLKDAGMTRVEFHLLPEGRHMLLREKASGTEKTVCNLIAEFCLNNRE